VVDYINKQSGINLSPVFDQYLHYNTIPILELQFKDGKAYVKWTSADAKGFNMPVKVRVKGGDYKFVNPTSRFKPLGIEGATKDNIEVDTFNYYIGVLVE
jgi:hypothetical protein